MRQREVGPQGGHTAALRVALSWLAHPMSVGAVAVLLLNDHVLKAEFGAWWTGKLSDVAGLVFAPALLTVGVALLAHRAQPRQVAATSLAIVGVLFVAVKATETGAATASAVWSAIAGPSIVRADATDLLTLPALALAWWTFTRAATRPAATRTVTRARTLILVPLATLAVAATSVADGSHDLPAAEDVYVTDEMVAVLVYSGYEYGDTPAAWWTRPVDSLEDPGVAWRESHSEIDGLPADLFGPGAPSSALVCLPDSPDVCFRWAGATPDIEESADGGATWTRAWGLTDAQHQRLDEWMGYSGWIRSERPGLALAETASGTVVVAAAEVYGVVVRTVDGEWLDLGLPGFGGSLVIPTTTKETYFLVSPFLIGLGAGGSAALIALALAARTRPWTTRRIVIPLGIVPWAALLITGAVADNSETAWPDSDLSTFRDQALLMLIVGTLWTVLATVLARPFAPGARARPWLAAACAGVATATVAAFIPPTGAGTATAVVAGMVAATGAVVWARRHRARWRATRLDPASAASSATTRPRKALPRVARVFVTVIGVVATFLVTGFATMAMFFAAGLGFGPGIVHGTIEPSYAEAAPDSRDVMSTMTTWDLGPLNDR